MGKRSDFERKPRDFYPTPIEAVEPLLPHLPEGFTFAEPCAGNGALIEHLENKLIVCSQIIYKPGSVIEDVISLGLGSHSSSSG